MEFDLNFKNDYIKNIKRKKITMQVSDKMYRELKMIGAQTDNEVYKIFESGLIYFLLSDVGRDKLIDITDNHKEIISKYLDE